MKILVVYAESGAGHRRAAESISRAAGEIYPELELKLINSLDYSTPFFQAVYPRTYLYLVTYFPPVWGFFYHLTNCRSFYPLVGRLRRLGNYCNSRRLVRYLRQENPGVIISTHFYASEVVADLKRKGENWRLISVVTDLRLHRFWVTEPVDEFVVGSEETGADLIRAGVRAEKVKILGIPISPFFSRTEKREELIRKLNLRENLPTILLVSGGFGVGPIARLVNCLGNLTVYSEANQREKRLQLLVVCGRKERLYRKVKKMAAGLRNPVEVYRFVENMHELMAVSDLLIGKSGGLTIAEALAKNLPLIVISPIPGQERKNCELLLKWGVAVRIRRIEEADRVVGQFFRSPGRLQAFRVNIEKHARPGAAAGIVKEAVKLAHSS